VVRLLHFPGETLWQGQDDGAVVTLLRKNRFVGLIILNDALECRHLCHVKTVEILMGNNAHSMRRGFIYITLRGIVPRDFLPLIFSSNSSTWKNGPRIKIILQKN
jgi:hypothetical protein